MFNEKKTKLKKVNKLCKFNNIHCKFNIEDITKK